MSMLYVVLDAQHCPDPPALHAYFAETLCFPPWYGRNLDALFDCLTDLPEEAVIQIPDRSALEAALGDYAGRVFLVLRRAAEVNPRLSLQVL